MTNAALLIAAEALLRGSRKPEAVALWTGYRLGVLDAIAPETFAGLLDREVDGLLGIAKGGYIAGRAGMTTTEVLDQLDRERHEAVARMTGIGLKRKTIELKVPGLSKGDEIDWNESLS